MGGELSILRLVLDASLIVQIVMGLLLAASIMSWAIILGKRGVIRSARAEAERFEEQFWVGGGDLTALYREIDARAGVTGMASIFAMGFREFARLRQRGSVAPEQMLEGARHATTQSRGQRLVGQRVNGIPKFPSHGNRKFPTRV